MFAHPPARTPWRGCRTRGAWLYSSSSQLLHRTLFLTVVISAGVHVATGRISNTGKASLLTSSPANTPTLERKSDAKRNHAAQDNRVSNNEHIWIYASV